MEEMYFQAQARMGQLIRDGLAVEAYADDYTPAYKVAHATARGIQMAMGQDGGYAVIRPALI